VRRKPVPASRHSRRHVRMEIPDARQTTSPVAPGGGEIAFPPASFRVSNVTVTYYYGFGRANRWR